VEKDGVADAGLCRGALGIAHVCNRFYHAERNPRHRDAANLWFHRGLDLWKTGSGLTESSSSLLDGGVGVALASFRRLIQLLRSGTGCYCYLAGLRAPD